MQRSVSPRKVNIRYGDVFKHSCLRKHASADTVQRKHIQKLSIHTQTPPSTQLQSVSLFHPHFYHLKYLNYWIMLTPLIMLELSHGITTADRKAWWHEALSWALTWALSLSWLLTLKRIWSNSHRRSNFLKHPMFKAAVWKESLVVMKLESTAPLSFTKIYRISASFSSLFSCLAHNLTVLVHSHCFVFGCSRAAVFRSEKPTLKCLPSTKQQTGTVSD